MNVVALGEHPSIDLLIDHHLPAAAGGDQAAYGRIVSACQNSITAIALAIVRDVPASEDIAQEAFLSAWQNLRRLQNPASFLPWLRQITRNLARDHLRTRRRRPCSVADTNAAIEAAADPAPDPFQRLLESEHQVLAADLISALPDDNREVLLLYYREGQSSRQVASLLGLSDAAVRKRLSRARQVVRQELLVRLGEFARESAPSIAFSSMVASALSLASPPAAAAAIFTGAGGAIGAKTLGKMLLGSAGSMGIAGSAALAGIYLGLRRQLDGALDASERQGLIRSAAVSAAVSIAFLMALVLLQRWTTGWVAPLLAGLVFMALVFHQSLVVQPRLLRRRHAHEARQDPAGAARRRRRERIQCWIAASVGLLGGMGGLVYGLVLSGRL